MFNFDSQFLSLFNIINVKTIDENIKYTVKWFIRLQTVIHYIMYRYFINPTL